MKKTVRKIEFTWEESRTVEIQSWQTDLRTGEGDQIQDVEQTRENQGEFNQITNNLYEEPREYEDKKTINK